MGQQRDGWLRRPRGRRGCRHGARAGRPAGRRRGRRRRPAGTLAQAGTAIRIATGAPLPAGADAVVQVELTTPLADDGSPAGPRGRQAIGAVPASVAIHAGVPAGASIRRRGSDLTAGSVVLAAGDTIGPATVGLVAGAGVGSVSVHRRPLVAVLATGDEVRAAGNALGPSGIPDANGPGLRALAAAAGAQVIDLGIARDRLDDVVARLRRGVAEADIVIVSGASRWVRTTSSGPPSRPSGRLTCGGSRSSPASRSPSALPGEATGRRSCSSACPAIRSRAT